MIRRRGGGEREGECDADFWCFLVPSGAMSAKVEHQIIFVVQLNPKIQEKTSISEYLVECYQMGVFYKTVVLKWCRRDVELECFLGNYFQAV